MSHTDRVRVIGRGNHYVGKQGFTYVAGASAATNGTLTHLPEVGAAIADAIGVTRTIALWPSAPAPA